MAYRDMRDFLAAIEQRGKLRRISRLVDPAWEPACLAKWMFQAMLPDDRFGLLFENVKGSAIKLMTGVLGASEQTYAVALQTEPARINEVWLKALRNPIPPRTVQHAASREIVLVGNDANLSALPIPVWTPGKDPAPYLTTIVVTRNADTNTQNMGVYRTQVLGNRRVVVNLSPGRQGTQNCRTFTDRGRPAPIAWIIAAEPVVHLAAVANLPFGQDEIRVAGGLKGEPVDLVPAKTIDLLVPANAEMIIEGEIVPGELEPEGPFGEFAGYMGPVEPRPVARITAITHRREPIFYGYSSQMPPSESTVLQSLTNAGVILKMLRDDVGDQSVQDVYVDLTFGGLMGHGIVAITPQYPGHGRRVGRIVADTSPLKRVTVVDADVDIRDPLHVEWALNSRFNPARDTVIIDEVYFPIHMDPSIRPSGGVAGMGSKIVIDATQKIDPGPFSLPPRETMMRALETWREAGLPEFDIPKRARLRVEKS